MSRKPVFLTTQQVQAVHQRMIDEFGGLAGIRDAGLFGSAVAMPAQTFGGKFLHQGIPAMAAAYLFHLCQNHPFMDGNKRTALAVAETFLLLNGMELDADNDDVAELTLRVASGELDKAGVTDYFRKHVVDAQM